MDISKLILLSEFLGVGFFSPSVHFNQTCQRHRRLKKKLCSNKFCAKHSTQSSEIQISASPKQRLQSELSSSLLFIPSVDQSKCVNWCPVSTYVNLWEIRKVLMYISQGSTTQTATHPPRSWGTQHSTEGTPERFRGALGVFRERKLWDIIPQETRLGLLHCSKSNPYTKKQLTPLWPNRT